MPDLLELLPFGLTIINWLVYGTIIVHFLDQPDHESRLRFLLIVAGVFLISFVATGEFPFRPFVYGSEWPFMLRNMVLMVFLAFTGVDLLVDRFVVLGLFVGFAFSLSTQLFWAHLIGIIAFIVVTYGFITSAWKKIQQKQTLLQ